MKALRPVLLMLALLLGAWSLWVLENARSGVEITRFTIGPTPVTQMQSAPDGPAVVVAHGFAGSRQMMQGYGLLLAQAGYTVYAFDFEGHGRHPEPMSGDVDSIDGTTRLLVDQTRTVLDHAQGTTDQPVALLGHSMATDILARLALEADGVGPLVLLSARSQVITGEVPDNLLIVTGAWEPGLTEFAENALWMVDADAELGETAMRDGITRRAVLAPYADHVSILFSRAGRAEALSWLNRFYERHATPHVWPSGWALLGLLAAIAALFFPVSRLLSRSLDRPPRLTPSAFAVAVVPAMVITPLVAVMIEVAFLPALVVDYLVVHLALYGVILGGLLLWIRPAPRRPDLAAAILLAGWAVFVFGMALDRYGANFWPTGERLALMGALCVGAIPFMLADSWLAYAAPLWQRVLARLAFLVSLGAAVALDPGGLFFLVMIAPVFVLFFLTMGLMGRITAHRNGAASAGLGLGLALAWALGVSFPLFMP